MGRIVHLLARHHLLAKVITSTCRRMGRGIVEGEIPPKKKKHNLFEKEWGWLPIKRGIP